MVTPGPEEFITLVYWTSSQMELRMLMTKETFMKLLPHPQQQLIQLDPMMINTLMMFMSKSLKYLIYLSRWGTITIHNCISIEDDVMINEYSINEMTANSNSLLYRNYANQCSLLRMPRLSYFHTTC